MLDSEKSFPELVDAVNGAPDKASREAGKKWFNDNISQAKKFLEYVKVLPPGVVLRKVVILALIVSCLEFSMT